MAGSSRIRWIAITAALVVVSSALTSAKAPSAQDTTLKPAPQHDGQHDFDFLVGSWKIHLKRRLHPLSGSKEWVEFDGTVVCRKVWGDRSELEEFDVNSPEKHIE